MATTRAPRSLVELIRELVRLTRTPDLLIWGLMVLSNSFYILPNGLPQPGDVLLLPLLPLALLRWNGRLARVMSRPLRVLFILVVWVMIVDWGWALILGEFGLFGKDTFLLFPAYYAYNALVFFVGCVLAQRHGSRFLWVTMNAVFASLLMQIAASFLVHRGGGRGVGFFSNPNQLGFFALVAASILTLGKRQLGFGAMKTGIGLTAALYLSLVSASRAAVGGIAILFALTMIANPRRMLVASLAILALISIGGPVSNAIEGTQQRIQEDRFQQYSFFQVRGYDRIASEKEYWLLGAGEGGVDRFEGISAGTLEIHSSVGTVFFSYGIVGLALFLSFLYRVAERAPLRMQMMLLPTFTYMVAHQGLRATYLWLMYVVFVAMKQPRPSARPVVAATSPVPAAVPA